MADKSQLKQRKPRGPGERFERGQSGNPAGRKPGTRNKATILAEQLLLDDINDVVRALVAKAKEGDVAAARLIVERALPPLRKARPVAMALPKVAKAEDVPTALSALLSLVAAGEIAAAEASEVAAILESMRRSIETAGLEALSVHWKQGRNHDCWPRWALENLLGRLGRRYIVAEWAKGTLEIRFRVGVRFGQINRCGDDFREYDRSRLRRLVRQWRVP
jgi:hypothetical protein